MDFLILFLIFWIGLIWGSFINAAIYRTRHKKDLLLARSMCPHCKHQLSVLDLIPVVSFLLLRGKCRYCQKNISVQYPIVELLVGILFVVFFVNIFGVDFDIENLGLRNITLLLRDWVAVCVLVFIFIYDLKYYLILDRVSLPAVVFFLVINLFLVSMYQNLLLGGIIGFGFFFLQYILSSGRWIGGGDLRMGLLMGVLLGWKNLIIALVLAYWSGALIGLILVFIGKKKFGSCIPFGTFLGVATLATILWGETIMNWYFALSL